MLFFFYIIKVFFNLILRLQLLTKILFAAYEKFMCDIWCLRNERINRYYMFYLKIFSSLCIQVAVDLYREK